MRRLESHDEWDIVMQWSSKVTIAMLKEGNPVNPKWNSLTHRNKIQRMGGCSVLHDNHISIARCLVLAKSNCCSLFSIADAIFIDRKHRLGFRQTRRIIYFAYTRVCTALSQG